MTAAPAVVLRERLGCEQPEGEARDDRSPHPSIGHPRSTATQSVLWTRAARCHPAAVSAWRTLGLVIAAVASNVAGLVVAFAFREVAPVQAVPQPTPAGVTRAAMLRESALATRLGFAAPTDITATATPMTASGVAEAPVSLGARECVAVVVGATGYRRVVAVTLHGAMEDGTIAELVGDRPDGAAGQVQFCATRAMSATLRVQTVRRSHEAPARYTGCALTIWSSRAPWSATRGFDGLRRGGFDARAVALAGRDAVWDEMPGMHPGETSPAWPTVMVGASAAAVVPQSAEMAAWVAALGAYETVVDVGFNEFRRVVLAIEAPPEAEGCVTVVLGRDRYRTRAAVWRWTGTGAPVALEERMNLASDRVCPGSGRRVYVVADDNRDAYRVEGWR